MGWHGMEMKMEISGGLERSRGKGEEARKGKWGGRGLGGVWCGVDFDQNNIDIYSLYSIPALRALLSIHTILDPPT